MTPNDMPTSQLLTGYCAMLAAVALAVALQIATDAYKSSRGGAAPPPPMITPAV